MKPKGYVNTSMHIECTEVECARGSKTEPHSITTTYDERGCIVSITSTCSQVGDSEEALARLGGASCAYTAMQLREACKIEPAYDGARWVIVGNGSYGLWFGYIVADDASISRTKSVRVFQSRNIRLWYGRRGGITSLAAFGVCGPRKAESRMGAPIHSTLLLDVQAVQSCSPEAVFSFSTVSTHND